MPVPQQNLLCVQDKSHYLDLAEHCPEDTAVSELGVHCVPALAVLTRILATDTHKADSLLTLRHREHTVYSPEPKRNLGRHEEEKRCPLQVYRALGRDASEKGN